DLVDAGGVVHPQLDAVLAPDVAVARSARLGATTGWRDQLQGNEGAEVPLDRRIPERKRQLYAHFADPAIIRGDEGAFRILANDAILRHGRPALPHVMPSGP
ncbi:MAG: hypothetical protein M3440_06305, partial [Chloroflexota bacterium]|nr:hypothetical protein [Chloroflexota bacterium]